MVKVISEHRYSGCYLFLFTPVLLNTQDDHYNTSTRYVNVNVVLEALYHVECSVAFSIRYK